ncbi:MAG: branched-chain amino acid ABC transporter permease [Deltaproteobacteria bacterium]|nr:branched-chain amino acid ABC transporter permease [Deltaproteobacteria bacterium]
MTVPRAIGVAAAIAVVSALAAAPRVAGDYLIGVGLSLFTWVALTQSWAVFSGMSGYISLGHSVFYGIGAYVMVLTWRQVPLWAGGLLAGLASGLFALAVGYPVLRVRGPYFVILTYGLAELVKYMVINLEAALGKSSRLLFGAPGLEELYYVMLGLAAAATALTAAVRASRFGGGLRAIREDEEAAETLGVPAAWTKALAFTLSAVVPGVVGAVMAMRLTYFQPLQVFSPALSFTIVTMAIVGGSDRAPGPLLGVLFLGTASELLWASTPEIYMILLGILLIAFVLLAPDGIYGQILGRRGGKGPEPCSSSS